MKDYKTVLGLLGTLCALTLTAPTALAQATSAPGSVQNNQYYVVFQAIPKSKAGLQRVNVTTEVPNAETAAPDNAWVPAAK